MTTPKRTKPDGNQAKIVKELRSLGFDVDIVCDLPGLYDLVVSGNKWVQSCKQTIPAVAVRVEIKAKRGVMYPSETKYFELQRHPENYIVARCTEDVLEWFQR